MYTYTHTRRELAHTKVLAIQIPEISSQLISKLEQEGQKYFHGTLCIFSTDLAET